MREKIQDQNEFVRTLVVNKGIGCKDAALPSSFIEMRDTKNHNAYRSLTPLAHRDKRSTVFRDSILREIWALGCGLQSF